MFVSVGVGVVEDRAQRRAPERQGRDQVEPLGRRREVVQEEPEYREVPRLGDPFREQDQDLALGQPDLLRQGDPVVDVDAEEVGGEGERPLIDDRPGAVVARLLRLELAAAPRHRDGGRGRNDAVVGQLPADEGGRHVERVLLPGRRRPEPGADRGAQRERVVQRDAGRDLAVRRRAEVTEVLEADRGAERPAAARVVELEVAVDRHVAAAPGSRRRVGPVAVEAVRPGAEALGGVRADLPRRIPAGADRELLVAPLRARREVHDVGGGVRDVEVEVNVVLPVAAGVERGRRVVAERRVDRIEDELIDVAGADVDARVPVEAAAREPAQSADERIVDEIAAELRREPAGEPACGA